MFLQMVPVTWPRMQGLAKLLLAVLLALGLPIAHPVRAQDKAPISLGPDDSKSPAGSRAGQGGSAAKAAGARGDRRPVQKRADSGRSDAKPRQVNEQARMADIANANTVSVISGTAASAYFRIASDLPLVLDDGEELRILPIQGRGGAQNGYDVLLLKGVDLGFVKADTLDLLKSDKRLTDVEKQLAYVARLFNDELHVITTKDITEIKQLVGKKVSFDVLGSGTNHSGQQVFGRLGIKVEPVNVDQSLAMEMLRKGELAAVVSFAAKPVRFVSDIPAGSNFHLIGVPYQDDFGTLYPPTAISNADYPNLVGANEGVDTVAVSTILAVYNWPKGTERYRKVSRFVDAFFSKFGLLQKPPRQPKWREVNLSAIVPGWTRFPAAQEWLDRNKTNQATDERFAQFEQFIKEKGSASPVASASEADKAKFFKEFLEWQKTRP